MLNTFTYVLILGNHKPFPKTLRYSFAKNFKSKMLLLLSGNFYDEVIEVGLRI